LFKLKSNLINGIKIGFEFFFLQMTHRSNLHFIKNLQKTWSNFILFHQKETDDDKDSDKKFNNKEYNKKEYAKKEYDKKYYDEKEHDVREYDENEYNDKEDD